MESMVTPQKYTSYQDLPLILSVDQLMQVLSVGKNTAYELIRCKKIGCIRIGRQIRVPKDCLMAFLQKND